MLAEADTTEDAALGGRLVLRQPKRGHRFGHDAILLAAAVDARPGEIAVDLGAGVGTAGLALAHRVPDLKVRLVEVDTTLADLARENAARNRLSDRVSVATLDVAAERSAFERHGMVGVDHVLMNEGFIAPLQGVRAQLVIGVFFQVHVCTRQPAASSLSTARIRWTNWPRRVVARSCAVPSSRTLLITSGGIALVSPKLTSASASFDDDTT